MGDGEGETLVRLAELEVWVLSVVERALAGRPSEDARVELKSDWPGDAAGGLV
jgi:hypothetical protein